MHPPTNTRSVAPIVVDIYVFKWCQSGQSLGAAHTCKAQQDAAKCKLNKLKFDFNQVSFYRGLFWDLKEIYLKVFDV